MEKEEHRMREKERETHIERATEGERLTKRDPMGKRQVCNFHATRHNFCFFPRSVSNRKLFQLQLEKNNFLKTRPENGYRDSNSLLPTFEEVRASGGPVGAEEAPGAPDPSRPG